MFNDVEKFLLFMAFCQLIIIVSIEPSVTIIAMSGLLIVTSIVFSTMILLIIQCKNSRSPVRHMPIPYSSHAFVTESSEIDPPGCTVN